MRAVKLWKFLEDDIRVSQLKSVFLECVSFSVVSGGKMSPRSSCDHGGKKVLMLVAHTVHAGLSCQLFFYLVSLFGHCFLTILKPRCSKFAEKILTSLPDELTRTESWGLNDTQTILFAAKIVDEEVFCIGAERSTSIHIYGIISYKL